MNKFIVIACLAAVASASYQLKDTHTILSEIDQDKFGATMLSAIQLNMASKAPMEDINLLIDKIIQNLEKKQDELDKQNETNQADCVSTIKSLKAQVSETNLVIKKTTAAIKENDDLLQNARLDLKQAKEDYEETVKAIETGTAERKAAHEKWANQDYEQTIQITTLDEGVKLVNHMLHGVAFSQIEARYQKVVDQLKNSKGAHSGLFKPLVTSLISLTNKLNYDNVMNIIKLLGEIRASIVEQQSEDRQAEEKIQGEWEAALKVLEGQKKALASKKTRLTNFITTTESLLKELNKTLETTKVNNENLKTSLKEKEDQCQKWATAYATESKEISRQLVILGKLRDHMAQKQQAVQEYVKQRNANAPAL